MPQIGPLEILIVAVLALVVFGPERLPEMARSVGKGVTQLKRMASEVKSEFELSMEEENVPTPVSPGISAAQASKIPPTVEVAADPTASPAQAARV